LQPSTDSLHPDGGIKMFSEGMPQVDASWVAIGLAVIGFIVWLSRVESITGTNKRDIAREEKARLASESEIKVRLNAVEVKHHELDNRIMDRLSNIERSMTERLSRIEGKLDK
jgi:hypothetical protein